jgi:hypothetical protein
MAGNRGHVGGLVSAIVGDGVGRGRGAGLIVAALVALLTAPAAWAAAPAGCRSVCMPDETRDANGCCVAPGAASATSAVGCPGGQEIGPDTQGHCCWPQQAWNGEQCVGRPASCLPDWTLSDAGCALPSCDRGRVRASDGVHCCWQGQAWSTTQKQCIGVPSCPDGLARRDATCDSPATAAPVQAGRTPLSAAALSQDERIIDDSFRQEAVSLCRRSGQTGWWFCTRERALTENAFLIQYASLTADHSLDDQIDVGNNYGIAWTFTELGLVGIALGGIPFALILATRPDALSNSDIAAPVGLTAAMGIMGGVFAGVGTIQLLVPRAERARSDQKATEHHLTPGRAVQAARAFNDALYRKLRMDAGLPPRAPPEFELATVLPAE